MTESAARILVVDDEFSVRDSLSNWFRKDGYQVRAVGNATDALRALQDEPLDVALLDIKMPGMDGMELQEHIHRIDPQIAVIMITAFASVDTAVRALKQGAFDYVTKPIDPDELSHLVRRALEQRRLERENTQLRSTLDELVAVDTIVGDSPTMHKVMELVRHVAKTDATVLIRGESGTGKELIARAIHANSARRYFPIVPVNCGAMPDSLLESELFGHEKGAFTGAQYRRKGKIEMADGGTLFLDEVGAIPPKMQVDLLRVLETKELTRLGGSRSVKVDFRVICATNENLEKAVKAGTFREDFYYRINVFTIDLPPLRERRADIPLLARHFRRALRPADGQADHRHQRSRDGAPGRARLAGQRARALQRHRAGHGRRHAAGDPPRRSAAARTPHSRRRRRLARGNGEAPHRRRAGTHRLEHHPHRGDPEGRSGHDLQQDQALRARAAGARGRRSRPVVPMRRASD